MSTIQTAALSVVDSRTTCPFCSCGCGLYLTKSGNRLSGVAPSANHPISRGHLCARGWAAHEATHWGARNTAPMVRHHGELRPTSWDDALDEAASRLARLRDAGAALGVIGSGRATTEDNFMATLLARSALRSGHLGMFPGYWSSEMAHAALAASPGLFEAVERADLVIMVEGDLAETHPRLASAALHAARRGARLVTIGTAPTRMSEIAATHLSLNAPMRLETFDTLLDVARGQSPADAPAAMAPLVESLRATERAVILVGAFAPDASLFAAATRALALLAREVRPSGGAAPVLPLPPRANTMGAWWAGVAPDRLPGGAAMYDDAAADLLADLCGAPVCVEPGATLADLLTSVAGMVVLDDDVVSHARRRHRAAAALSKLDTLIVLDAFHTHATRQAHVVLPTAAFGESAGSFIGIHGGAQDTPPCVEPPAAARPGWHVLSQLAQRLGAGFTPSRIEDVRDALARFGAPASRARVTAAPPDVPRIEEGAGGHPLRLMVDGGFDWGAEVMVASSPSLRRDAASRHKQWPRGLVTISPTDATSLGLREHARVKITSERGSATTAASVREGQTPGTVLLPFAMRDAFHDVLGDHIAVTVEVSGA